MKIRALGIKFPSSYILLSCHEYLISVIKNKEHKDLFKKLMDLKINIKFRYFIMDQNLSFIPIPPPAEFWVIGIIKCYNKRVRNNLWIITLDKKTADIKLTRFSPDINPIFIASKYYEKHKAELTMLTLEKKQYLGLNRFDFCLIHFKDGKFLDDRVQEDN